MIKTFKKSTAFISAAVMFMTMLLYFPSGIFSNIQWRLSASAATVELSEPAEGDGSSDNPYQIGTAAELYWFAACVNGTDGVTQNRNACAKLTADIIVNKEQGEVTDDGTLNAYTWTPIGNDSSEYTGTFDGQNHTISGLYFNDTSTSYVGLFGFSSGTIKNVGVVESDFKGYNFVGGVCGYSSGGTIENCYNEGAVSGTGNNVGGVCGDNYNTGTIENCYNTGTVEGLNEVGGVCGKNFNGTITNCYNTGTVSGSEHVGGVCGANIASLSSKTATIENCYNNGKVSGSKYVGGVCGYNYASGGTATISDCTNNGEVSGSGNVGGVCGENNGTISNCTNNNSQTIAEIGSYNVEIGSDNSISIGSVCGKNASTIENCTATIATIQITELTLTAENLTINAGGITGMNEKGIIRNSKSENLTLNLPKKLSSTESGRLKANLGGTSGTNDAGVISKCTNETVSIGVPETVQNLSVTAGGVCGTNTNTGTLSSCSNSGELKLKKLTVSSTTSSLNTSTAMYLSSAPTFLSEEGESGESGEFVIGGVVGTNENSTVENSYNTGAVSTEVGNATVGGVTGQNTNNGTTQSCYNSGTISATGENSVTGGVCGNNESGTVASCYFNSENSTTGVGSGSGTTSNVMGKTTAELNSADFCETIGYHSPQASNDFKCIHCQQYDPAKYNNGTYEISNASQLYWFANKVNNENSTYKNANAVLTADITVNSNVLVNGALNTTESTDFTSWTPIGNSSSQYTGTFDGQNHTVSGLYCSSGSDYIGLFGFVFTGGKVSNVGLINSYIKGKNYVGGVCGCLRNAEINNCYSTSFVTGSGCVGGICGLNSDSIITNCYNTGSVSGTGSDVGSVCGYSSTTKNCYYLNTTATDGSSTAKTTSQFQSGEVAYLLSQGCTVDILNGIDENNTPIYIQKFFNGSVWGQQIGTDNYPVLGGAKVYQNVSYEQCESSPGTPTYSYENEQKDPVYQEHSYVDGYCEWCRNPEACQHVAGISVRTNIVAPTCTYYGYYTRITYCALCGGEMSRKIYYTMPTGHDCTSGGICKTCGVPANGRDGFKSASLTLTDGVILNYYLLLSDEALADTGAYIHFTSPQGVDSKIMLSEGIEDNGRYKFSLELRPDQMADVITAQVVYSDDVQGSSINYSVQKYLENADSSVSELADAMMNFGAFTQLYTGRNTDNLAADVADYTVNAVIGNEYKHQLSGSASGISVKGATLQIGAYTTIRVKYQLAQGEDISKYTFKCGDTILEPEKSGDYYYVYLRNIRPQNLDEMYSFTVTDGTNTATLKYSAFSYMKNILDNADKYDKNIVNLMNAMYDYNKAADAYNN